MGRKKGVLQCKFTFVSTTSCLPLTLSLFTHIHTLSLTLSLGDVCALLRACIVRVVCLLVCIVHYQDKTSKQRLERRLQSVKVAQNNLWQVSFWMNKRKKSFIYISSRQETFIEWMVASNFHRFIHWTSSFKVDSQAGIKTRASFYAKGKSQWRQAASVPEVFLRHVMRIAPGLGFVKAGQKRL